jgi:hypothetical protein
LVWVWDNEVDPHKKSYEQCVCSSMISVVISAVFYYYFDGKVIVVKFDTIVYYSLVYN